MSTLAQSVRRVLRVARDHVQLISVTVGGLAGLVYTAVKVTSGYNRLQADIAILSERLSERLARAQAELAKAQAEQQAAVAVAQKETGERFLLYGFTEEYQKYQARVKGSQPNTESDQASVR